MILNGRLPSVRMYEDVVTSCDRLAARASPYQWLATGGWSTYLYMNFIVWILCRVVRQLKSSYLKGTATKLNFTWGFVVVHHQGCTFTIAKAQCRNPAASWICSGLLTDLLIYDFERYLIVIQWQQAWPVGDSEVYVLPPQVYSLSAVMKQLQIHNSRDRWAKYIHEFMRSLNSCPAWGWQS